MCVCARMHEQHAHMCGFFLGWGEGFKISLFLMSRPQRPIQITASQTIFWSGSSFWLGFCKGSCLTSISQPLRTQLGAHHETGLARGAHAVPPLDSTLGMRALTHLSFTRWTLFVQSPRPQGAHQGTLLRSKGIFNKIISVTSHGFTEY